MKQKIDRILAPTLSMALLFTVVQSSAEIDATSPSANGTEVSLPDCCDF